MFLTQDELIKCNQTLEEAGFTDLIGHVSFALDGANLIATPIDDAGREILDGVEFLEFEI